MFSDTNVERYPWTAVSGPNISKVPTTTFEAVLTSMGLRVYAAGPAWAGGLIKIPRPLYPGSTGLLNRSITFIPDESAVSNMQAWEFDIRLTDAAGYTYPFDIQADWAAFQIQTATGVQAGNVEWANTNIPTPALQAGIPITMNLSMSYNESNHTCSILSINGAAVPSALQNQPAFQASWTPNELVCQHQGDGKGFPFIFSYLLVNDSITYPGS